MNQKTKTIIKSLAFFLVFALTVVSFNVYAAFTSPPPGNPGDGNVETPINTSENLQIKKGGWIVAFERVIGILLVGGKAEFADTIKIYGGNPGVDKVLVSDNVGLASWRDVSTLPGWGGGSGTTPPPPPPPQGVVPVSLGGTGLTTIADHSIWVANNNDIISTLTPAGGESIRVNASGTNWESFTPVVSSGNGGTLNTISKFTGANSLGNSSITDDGQTITVGGHNFKIESNLASPNVIVNVPTNTTNLALPYGVNFQLKTTSGSAVTIQGFAPPSGGSHIAGRVVYLSNRSNQNFIIKENSTTTVPENRVQTSNNADLTLAPNKTIMLIYATTDGVPVSPAWVQALGPN